MPKLRRKLRRCLTIAPQLGNRKNALADATRMKIAMLTKRGLLNVLWMKSGDFLVKLPDASVRLRWGLFDNTLFPDGTTLSMRRTKGISDLQQRSADGRSDR